jgi:DNA modification methylase
MSDDNTQDGAEPSPASVGYATQDIYLADSLVFLKTIATASVDAVVTDPPYMLGSASARKSANKAIGWADINNASHWYTQWMTEAWRVMKPSASMWVFGNWRSFPVYQCAASKIPGMSVTSVLVWDKEWPSVGSTRGLRQNYEIVVLFGKGDFGIKDRTVGDIWKCRWTGHKPTGHPQEKPVELIERILEVSGVTAGVVLDPFAGSASVGVAARRRGCGFVGVELDDNHHAVGARRLQQA